MWSWKFEGGCRDSRIVAVPDHRHIDCTVSHSSTTSAALLIEGLLLVTLPSPHFDILGIITGFEGSASRSIPQLTTGLEASNRRSFRHLLPKSVKPSSVWSSDLPSPDKRRTVRTSVLSLATALAVCLAGPLGSTSRLGLRNKSLLLTWTKFRPEYALSLDLRPL